MIDATAAERRRSIETGIGLLLFASAIAFAVRETMTAPPWTVDDAFITARYADHLAHHGVFAYNLEGPRVEGITSPLFALIGTIASLLGIGPAVAMRWFGIGAYAASGPIIFAMARELRLPMVAAGAFVWLYLGIPEHITHATSGLETEAFALAELVAVLCLMRWWRAPIKNHGSTLVLTCLAACLLRPEGFAVAAVVVTMALYRVRAHGKKAARTHLLRWVGFGLVVPLAAVVAARFAYFHALLPNTFYAKRRGPVSYDILRDMGMLTEDYLLDVIVVSVALWIIARVLGVRRGRIGNRAPMLLVVSLSVLGAFAAAYLHKDVMNYSRRFAIHGLPWAVTVMLVIASVASARLRQLRVRRGPLAYRAATALGVAFVAAMYVPRWQLRHAAEIQSMADHVTIRRERGELVRATLEAYAKKLGRTPRLAVWPDAGYVPYRTDFPTVDFGRLNDGYLARQAKTTADVVNYFFANQIDAVVFSHYGERRMWNIDASEVRRDPRFADYALAGEWRGANGHGLSVYFRRSP